MDLPPIFPSKIRPLLFESRVPTIFFRSGHPARRQIFYHWEWEPLIDLAAGVTLADWSQNLRSEPNLCTEIREGNQMNEDLNAMDL